MPLLKGKSNVGHNVEEMEAHGHPRAQALAAALRTAGVPKKGDAGGALATAPSSAAAPPGGRYDGGSRAVPWGGRRV